MTVTRAFTPNADFEVRKNENGEVELRGMAVVYGARSAQPVAKRNGRPVYEYVDPDAKMRSSDLVALFDHKPEYVLGREGNGTLERRDTSAGIEVLIKPNMRTSWAQDLVESVRRGDIAGMSFGMNDVRSTYTSGADHYARHIRSATMPEVSIVTFPFYEQTFIEARSQTIQADLDAFEKSQPDHDRYEAVAAKFQGGIYGN